MLGHIGHKYQIGDHTVPLVSLDSWERRRPSDSVPTFSLRALHLSHAFEGFPQNTIVVYRQLDDTEELEEM